MAGWIRRQFDAAGLTQYPAGPALAAVQAGLSGTVILCIDVSGSMSGSLVEAKKGAKAFIAEALSNGYKVGLLAWSDAVDAGVDPPASADELDSLLARMSIAGGTNVVPALRWSHARLKELAGDRVVAVFGDGDLGPVTAAKQVAAELVADGIRIITMGLGDGSAAALSAISTEIVDQPRVASSDTLAEDIAGLAAGLKKPGSP